MANVMTEAEIRKFQGRSEAFLPLGTILTPAAKDWAQEQHLKICFGETNQAGMPQPVHGVSKERDQDKTAVLHQVVTAVIRNMKQSGQAYSPDILVPVIIQCLERLGCRVK